MLVYSKKYMRHLLIETSVQFTKKTNNNNKKMNKYIYGLRMDTMILSIHDMRSMITKIYPLIHNLFYNHSLKYQPIARKIDPTIIKSRDITPLQILFTSSTNKFTHIVEDAATFCHMPYYTQAWANGLFTKPLNTIDDEDRILDINNLKQFQYINIKDKFFNTRHEYGFLNRKYFNIWHPSLLILPDPSNNPITWKEAKRMNIPIISLTSGDSLLNPNYSVFGDETSIVAVSFFCTLISWVVKKENAMFNFRNEILGLFRLKEKYIKPFILHNQKSRYTNSNLLFSGLYDKSLKDIRQKNQRENAKRLWRWYQVKHMWGQNRIRLWRLRSLIDRRDDEFNDFYAYCQKLQNTLLKKITNKIQNHSKKTNIEKLKKIHVAWKKFITKQSYAKNKHHLHQPNKLTKWFFQLYFTKATHKKQPRITDKIKTNLLKTIVHELNFKKIFLEKTYMKKKFLTVKDIAWNAAQTKNNKSFVLHTRFVKDKYIHWARKSYYSWGKAFWKNRLDTKLARYKRWDYQRARRSFWRIFIRNVKKQFRQERTLRPLTINKKKLTNKLNLVQFPTYFNQTKNLIYNGMGLNLVRLNKHVQKQ